jgi:hypothetical protein
VVAVPDHEHSGEDGRSTGNVTEGERE